MKGGEVMIWILMFFGAIAGIGVSLVLWAALMMSGGLAERERPLE